ncbi:hypothetical protein CCYA_CCYA07G2177 [Cyanidiococcus yangmingshanensis]|nr:hypothetical protein CCYA_CCYA07G2177 [Cyanidiococcus yangmingshanensis]
MQYLHASNDGDTDLGASPEAALGGGMWHGGGGNNTGRFWRSHWGADDPSDGSDDPNETYRFEQGGEEAYGGAGASPSSHEQLLRNMNRTAESIPRELFALDLESARRYLQATAGGLPRFLTDRFPAWRAKMLADPNFFFKLLMEETVGMGLCLTGVIIARGDRLMQELDFVLIDTLVGASLSFVLIWLLAPSIPMGSMIGQQPVKGNAWSLRRLQSYLGDLPSCAFAPGTRLQHYDWTQRAAAFLYKGSLFAMAGFAAGVIGTSLGYALLALRKRYTGCEPENRMPPILAMSLGWAGFMFVSANPRYQLVTATELWIYEKTSPAIAKASTAILRTTNSIAGGATWVLWARALGLNQSGDPSTSMTSRADETLVSAAHRRMSLKTEKLFISARQSTQRMLEIATLHTIQ